MIIRLSTKLVDLIDGTLRAAAWVDDELVLGGDVAALLTLKGATPEQRLDGHRGAVSGAAFNRRFTRLTTWDDQGTIIVWRRHHGQWVEDLVNERGVPVTALRWSPDGRHVGIIYHDGHLTCGHVRGHRLFGKLVSRFLADVLWFPDSSRLVAMTSKGEAYIYDLEGRMVARWPSTPLSTAQPGVKLVCADWYGGQRGRLAPETPTLAMVNAEGALQLSPNHDFSRAAVVPTGLQGAPRLCQWSHDGSVLAVADDAAVHFLTSSGARLGELALEHACQALAWDHHGGRLAVVAGGAALIVLVLRDRWNVLRTLDFPREAAGVCFSWDHSTELLAAAQWNLVRFYDVFGFVCDELQLVTDQPVTHLLWSAADDVIAIAQRHCPTIVLWSKKLDVTTVDCGASLPVSLAWAPSGPRLAVGTSDGNCLLYDCATGERQHVLCPHGGAVTAMQWRQRRWLLLGSGAAGGFSAHGARGETVAAARFRAAHDVRVLGDDSFAVRSGATTLGTLEAGEKREFAFQTRYGDLLSTHALREGELALAYSGGYWATVQHDDDQQGWREAFAVRSFEQLVALAAHPSRNSLAVCGAEGQIKVFARYGDGGGGDWCVEATLDMAAALGAPLLHVTALRFSALGDVLTAAASNAVCFMTARPDVVALPVPDAREPAPFDSGHTNWAYRHIVAQRNKGVAIRAAIAHKLDDPDPSDAELMRVRELRLEAAAVERRWRDMCRDHLRHYRGKGVLRHFELNSGKRRGACVHQWSPTNEFLAAALYDGSVHLLDADGRMHAEIAGPAPDAPVLDLSWAADGGSLAAVQGGQRQLLLWSAAEGRRLVELPDGFEPVCCAFDPAIERVAVGAASGALVVVDHRLRVRTLPAAAGWPVVALRWLGDSAQLTLVGEGHVAILEARGELQSGGAMELARAQAAAGRDAVVAVARAAGVHLWTRAARRWRRLEDDGAECAAVISPTALGDLVVLGTRAGALRVLVAESGAVLAETVPFEGKPVKLVATRALAPHVARVAACSRAGGLTAVDVFVVGVEPARVRLCTVATVTELYGALALGWTRDGRMLTSTQPEFVNVSHVSLDVAHKSGQSSLLCACRLGDAGAAVDLVRLGVLLDYQDQLGVTALMVAARSADGGLRVVVSALLEAKADLNVRNHRGETALLAAAAAGNAFAVQKLLEAGADARLADQDGSTPLMLARDAACLEPLLPQSDLHHQNADGDTALIVAARHRRRAVAARLLEAGADPAVANAAGSTALHFAAKADMAEVLLPRPAAEVNAAARNGCTPLMCAAAVGAERAVSALLTAGADAAAADADGMSALHCALQHGHALIAAVLIDAGAVLTLDTRRSALFFAVQAGVVEVGQLVLRHARGAPAVAEAEEVVGLVADAAEQVLADGADAWQRGRFPGAVMVPNPQSGAWNMELDLSKRQLPWLSGVVGRLGGVLVSLDLSHNQLTDLPPDFAALRLLRRLSLAHNCFEAMPAELFSLAELEELDVRGNLLRALPRGLLTLPKLTKLLLNLYGRTGDDDGYNRIEWPVRGLHEGNWRVALEDVGGTVPGTGRTPPTTQRDLPELPEVAMRAAVPELNERVVPEAEIVPPVPEEEVAEAVAEAAAAEEQRRADEERLTGATIVSTPRSKLRIALSVAELQEWLRGVDEELEEFAFALASMGFDSLQGLARATARDFKKAGIPHVYGQKIFAALDQLKLEVARLEAAAALLRGDDSGVGLLMSSSSDDSSSDDEQVEGEGEGEGEDAD